MFPTVTRGARTVRKVSPVNRGLPALLESWPCVNKTDKVIKTSQKGRYIWMKNGFIANGMKVTHPTDLDDDIGHFDQAIDKNSPPKQIIRRFESYGYFISR